MKSVIQYKTTNNTASLPPQGIKYSKQLRDYAKAMQLIDRRPIKLGLYFPANSIWKECND